MLLHNPIAQWLTRFAQRRPVITFACAFVLLYVLLIVPWPGWGKIYGDWFRWLCGLFFGGQHDARYVTFIRSGQPPHPDDTVVQIMNIAQAKNGAAPEFDAIVDAIGLGWRQTALLIALIVATPISWKRRGWALLWGLIAIHAIIVAFMGFHIWVDSAQVGLVTFTSFWQRAVEEITEFFLYLYSAVISVVLWILVTFRKDDRLATVGRAFFGPTAIPGEKVPAKTAKPARK